MTMLNLKIERRILNSEQIVDGSSLQIVEAARWGVRSECGGIALGSRAIIFVRSVTPKISAESAATHLGYVIAHELGHILLCPNAHSIDGIMRRTLLQEDWAKAPQG